MARAILLLSVLLAAFALSSAFHVPAMMPLTHNAKAANLQLRRPAVGRASFTSVKMSTLLESGELELTEDECDKLKLPPNSVIPVSSVAEIQQKLQDIDDEEVRKLFRQIGASPDEEPYPGYWADIERLELDESNMGTSSVNPASMYGPDGKAYAPWMVGKISEGKTKKKKDGKTQDQRNFEYVGRGQELSGSGMSCKLLGDEVRLGWNVGGEENSKGYVVIRRPGGSEDDAFKTIADYMTPGAMLNAGAINGEYSYVDGDVEPGVWVYRVMEEDMDGKRMMLSQSIIEVPSSSDKVKTLVAGGFLVTLLAIGAFLGLAADPQNGLN
eukprot:CAMPEP_0181308920 /NCGR_PEP_ID=MMETSP1101-20121128/11736_1 /TAXON_ID=46948 /ORGANISM="Rhodomonas abbreviata, Strain Caron Lab Isolate" /LENGTH=326 /DNA_ID=CAMNT_0023415367 /DNA_START=17 /DNA_END=997 /DNA_ORIENTATION=-